MRKMFVIQGHRYSYKDLVEYQSYDGGEDYQIQLLFKGTGTMEQIRFKTKILRDEMISNLDTHFKLIQLD